MQRRGSGLASRALASGTEARSDSKAFMDTSTWRQKNCWGGLGTQAWPSPSCRSALSGPGNKKEKGSPSDSLALELPRSGCAHPTGLLREQGHGTTAPVLPRPQLSNSSPRLVASVAVLGAQESRAERWLVRLSSTASGPRCATGEPAPAPMYTHRERGRRGGRAQKLSRAARAARRCTCTRSSQRRAKEATCGAAARNLAL